MSPKYSKFNLGEYLIESFFKIAPNIRMRTVMFLTFLSLGILPILSLVTINLAGHIERHENAANRQIKIQARDNFKLLNTHIKNIEDSFFQATGMIGTLSIGKTFSSQDMNEMHLSLILQWFSHNPEVAELILYDINGSERMHFKRDKNGNFNQVRATSISIRNKNWFRQVIDLTSENFFVDVLSTSQKDYFRIFAPIIAGDGQKKGLILLKIDGRAFLKDYQNCFWITNDGHYINAIPLMDGGSVKKQQNNETQRGKNSFLDFPGLQDQLQGNEPIIWFKEETPKITWIPVIFSKARHAAMWIGKPIDRSDLKKWKESLVFNVLWIVLLVTVVVLYIANTLAANADKLKKEILTGLDKILNEEKEVHFHWWGPEELQTMARELTLLSKNYTQTSNARKKAESALRESEDRFRNLTASAQDAITMMDNHGNICYWNKAAKRIFGYTSEEVLGKPIHALISPRLPPEINEENSIHTKPASDGPIRETLELLTTSKSGKEIPIELSLSEARVRDKWHSVWIIRDISERKRAEQRAREQQQQLIQADKMISLGMLIAGVAHEINNPNSIAMLNTSLLAKSWKSIKPILEQFYNENGDFLVAGLEYSEMREQIPILFTELEESAKRIKNIVQDLKDYSRQDTSKHVADLDINEIVEAAVRLTYNQIKNSIADFTTELDKSIPPIIGNKQRLEQVFINLIQNSCEAMQGKPGSLSIKTSYDSALQAVEIIVKDTGVGIPKKDISKIINPFFTTKRTVGGTGLGLSISFGIIREHHGLMQFTSDPKSGTVVTVFLPVEQSNNEA